MTGFSLTENIFIIGSLSPHVRESGIWEIFLRNPSSTDKESRMQYPWHRIENPRLSDFLAWADHYFQLDKIKDIMCFHYFIFATRKKSHKLQNINMQVFHFWEKETVYFPNVSVFSCILLPMKWANNNKLSLLWH